MADFAPDLYRLVEKIMDKSTDPMSFILDLKSFLGQNEWLYAILLKSPHLAYFLKNWVISTRIYLRFLMVESQHLERLVITSDFLDLKMVINQMICEMDYFQRISFLWNVCGCLLNSTHDIEDFSWVNPDFKEHLLIAIEWRFIQNMDFLYIKDFSRFQPFLGYYLREKGFFEFMGRIVENFHYFFPYSTLFKLLYPFREELLVEIKKKIDPLLRNEDPIEFVEKDWESFAYIQSIPWIAQNSEIKPLYSKLEQDSLFKKYSSVWDALNSFFTQNLQSSRRINIARETGLPYLIAKFAFSEDNLVHLNWSLIKKEFAVNTLEELLEKLFHEVQDSELISLMQKLLNSFYSSNSKPNHPYVKLLKLIEVYRPLLLKETFPKPMLYPPDHPTISKMKKWIFDASITFNKIICLPMNKEIKEDQIVDYLFSIIEGCSEIALTLFYSYPEYSKYWLRKFEINSLQDSALAFLYHLRYTQHFENEKQIARTIVFQNYNPFRIEIILFLYELEKQSFNSQYQYLNYFFKDPTHSLEIALNVLISSNPDITEEQKIISILDTIGELITAFPRESAQKFKEEFAKGSNLILITLSVILKYLFNTKKFNNGIQKNFVKIFEELHLLFNQSSSRMNKLTNEPEDHTCIQQILNPYGMLGDGKRKEEINRSRNYFNPIVLFSFYNYFRVQGGQRAFYSVSNENVSYYDTQLWSIESFILKRKKENESMMKKYVFEGLGFDSFHNTDILFQNGLFSEEVEENIGNISDYEYGFPESAGKYTIENYFSTFHPPEMQQSKTSIQKKKTLQFHSNMPLFSNESFTRIPPIFGYPDLDPNKGYDYLLKNISDKKEKQIINSWQLNFNKRQTEILNSEENTGFLTNLRWSDTKIIQMDPLIIEEEEILDDQKSRYLTEFQKQVEKSPIIQNDKNRTLQSHACSSSEIEKPPKNLFLGIYLKLNSEFIKISHADCTKRYHISKNRLRDLCTHQFVLWSKMFGLFKDPTLFHLLGMDCDCFNGIEFLNQVGRHKLFDLLYDAIFDDEDKLNELKQILQTEMESESVENSVSKQAASSIDDFLL